MKPSAGLSQSERVLTAVSVPDGVASRAQAGGVRRINAFDNLFRQSFWWLLGLPFLAFLGIPLVALLVKISPADLLANLRTPEVTQAVGLSLVTSVTSVLVTVLLGTPLSLILAKSTFPLRRVVDTLVDMPTVLPPAVAGVALLMAFGRRGLLGGVMQDLGIQISFTTAAVVMAQTFVASPFYIKAATLGFAAVDPELKHAAALDGASGWQILRHVTLPLAWAALLSGSVMTWARALGEFGATIIFAGNYPGRTQTMPMAIYIGFQMDLDVALTLAAILVLCSFVVLMVVKVLFSHREEQEGIVSR